MPLKSRTSGSLRFHQSFLTASGDLCCSGKKWVRDHVYLLLLHAVGKKLEEEEEMMWRIGNRPLDTPYLGRRSRKKNRSGNYLLFYIHFFHLQDSSSNLLEIWS